MDLLGALHGVDVLTTQHHAPGSQPCQSQATISCTCLQEDNSLTRSDAYFQELLRKAGYSLQGSALQRNFPKGLFQACCSSLCCACAGAWLRGPPAV